MNQTSPPLPPLPPPPSPRLVKGVGWLFIVTGLLLCAGMAFITLHMVGVVNTPTRPGRLPSWTGSHDFTVRMFEMFGGVFLFGLLVIANGAWCVRRGALQPVLRALLLLVGAGLFIAATLMSSHGR